MKGLSSLQGQYIVRVGEKYRVAFPTEFRKALGSTIVLTYGFESSLIAIAEKDWEALAQEIEGSSFLDSHRRNLRRIFIGGALTITCDTQGRFVVPDYLREYIRLDSEAVFIGQRSYAEIWNKKTWDTYRKESLSNIVPIANELSRNRTHE